MQFYIRVTTGHIGKYGKEIEEIEIIDGKTVKKMIKDKLL